MHMVKYTKNFIDIKKNLIIIGSFINNFYNYKNTKKKIFYLYLNVKKIKQ